MVLAAERKLESCAEALERLCRSYWPPIHAHVRRPGLWSGMRRKT